MIKSSLIIVDSGKLEVFIVENEAEKSQIEKIMDKSNEIKTEYNTEIIEEDNIIEEYLDEFYDELKNEELLNIYSDHKYTNVEQVEEANYETIEEKVLDVIYEEEIGDFDESNTDQKQNSSNSKKQYHKFHQLTGKAACKFCETIFKSKESLKNHLQNCKYLQCDPKNFICRICNKELSKKTFSNHLHEGILECQYCRKSFVNPRNLKTHIKKIHKNEEFIPPKEPNRTIVKELKVEEDEEQTVLDEQTGIITSQAAVEKEHPKKKYVKKTGRYECDLCGRIFSFARSLTTHLLLHTKDYRFVCEICGEKFTTRTGIAKHSCLNRKRKRPEKDFRTVDVRNCKYCDLWFSSYEENRDHTCRFQSTFDPKMFTCRFCMMEMSKNSYNKHMSRHLNPKEYICKLCDKKLACEKALITHLTTHSGNKPFICNSCGKSFINKTLLIRHSRFHGVNVPQYKCTVCDKEMASKYHLKTHMAQLHGEFQICQICKENFSTREKLKEHYQNSHEPFQCKFCSKNFVLPRYLKMHEKLHKGETTRQYNCTYCLRQFSKRALANHVFSSHQENFNEWRDKNMEFIVT